MRGLLDFVVFCFVNALAAAVIFAYAAGRNWSDERFTIVMVAYGLGASVAVVVLELLRVSKGGDA